MIYSKIEFGLKHHQKLYDCQSFLDLVDSIHIIISEHDGSIDDCERPGLHYHGIIEHEINTIGDNSEAILALKTHCSYFKIRNCSSPKQYIAFLVEGPKKVMIDGRRSVNLRTFYSEVTVPKFRLEPGHYEKEVSERENFQLILNECLSNRIFSPDEIGRQIEKNYHWLLPEHLTRLVTDAIPLVQQNILDQSVIELCGKFSTPSDLYHTGEESVDLILEWCGHQNIDVEAFTMGLVNCLDKQVVPKNSLYVQGSSESGIFSIINSIEEACSLIGKIEEETTGYTYVWEDCLDKRCIIMRDPVFDKNMVVELERILKGIGTFVPHRQNILKYLRPTPVIIISSRDNWDNDFYLQHLQSSFLQSYVNLKPFLKLHNDPRQLHPIWLYALYMHFNGYKVDTTVNYFEDNVKKCMDCDSSCESSDEGESSSSICDEKSKMEVKF